MGSEQSAPCINLGVDDAAPGNQSVKRSEGARELVAALSALRVQLSSIEHTANTSIVALSARLDGLEKSLLQVSMAVDAQRTELEGALSAIGKKLQQLEDAQARGAAKQRALLTAYAGMADEAAPPTAVRSLALELPSPSKAPPAIPPPATPTVPTNNGVAMPGAVPVAFPGGLPATPSVARAGVRRARDGGK